MEESKNGILCAITELLGGNNELTIKRNTGGRMTLYEVTKNPRYCVLESVTGISNNEKRNFTLGKLIYD